MNANRLMGRPNDVGWSSIRKEPSKLVRAAMFFVLSTSTVPTCLFTLPLHLPLFVLLLRFGAIVA